MNDKECPQIGLVNFDVALFKDLLVDADNVGVDIEEIARFKTWCYSSFKPFYERVFTQKEIEYCLSFKTPECHFASNFAGKEAIYKAIGRYQKIKLLNIEILRTEEGIPWVNLLSSIASDNTQTFNFQIKLSLSHCSTHAIAFAIVIYL